MRFNNKNKGVITVSQISASRKNRLRFEIAGSNQTFSWTSEQPNDLWIGKRDTYNGMLMRDPSLFDDESRNLIAFPGGHNEGFPYTSKQMFKEVYAAIAKSDPSDPTYPTFKDKLKVNGSLKAVKSNGG